MIGLEYRLENPTDHALECVFSFNARNFLAREKGEQAVRSAPGGFVLWAGGSEEAPWEEASFCARVKEKDARVNCAWFRGGWWDALTLAWKDVEEGACDDRAPVSEGEPAPGASLFVPVTLAPGAERTIVVQLSWYVGTSPLRINGKREPDPALPRYRPWYAERFADIGEVADDWRAHYAELREKTARFSALASTTRRCPPRSSRRWRPT